MCTCHLVCMRACVNVCITLHWWRMLSRVLNNRWQCHLKTRHVLYAVLRDVSQHIWAANMLTTVILSVLLMMGDLGRAAASDLHVFGKSICSDNTLPSGHDSRHTVRKQPHQQVRCLFFLQSQTFLVQIFCFCQWFSGRTNKNKIKTEYFWNWWIILDFFK